MPLSVCLTPTMTRHCFYFFLAPALLFSLKSSGQLPEVDWNKVTTYATWLNSYNEPCQLTLSINQVAAMRKVRPGGIFNRTKFPEGTFQAQITDSRSGKTIKSFPLTLNSSSSLLLVTRGNDEIGCDVLQFTAEHPNRADEKKPKQLTFVNAFPNAQLSVTIGGQQPRTLEIKESSTLQLSQDLLIVPVSAKLTNQDGVDRTEIVDLSLYVERGAVIVFHCDEVDQSIIKFTVFDGESFNLLSEDENAPKID